MIILMIKSKLFISEFNKNVKNSHSQAYDTLKLRIYYQIQKLSNGLQCKSKLLSCFWAKLLKKQCEKVGLNDLF